MNFIGVTGGPAFFVGAFGNEVSLSAMGYNIRGSDRDGERGGVGDWKVLQWKIQKWKP
jgi:hypothetical protein